MQLASDGSVNCLTLVIMELSRDTFQSIRGNSKTAQLKGLVDQGASSLELVYIDYLHFEYILVVALFQGLCKSLKLEICLQKQLQRNSLIISSSSLAIHRNYIMICEENLKRNFR